MALGKEINQVKALLIPKAMGKTFMDRTKELFLNKILDLDNIPANSPLLQITQPRTLKMLKVASDMLQASYLVIIRTFFALKSSNLKNKMDV